MTKSIALDIALTAKLNIWIIPSQIPTKNDFTVFHTLMNIAAAGELANLSKNPNTPSIASLNVSTMPPQRLEKNAEIGYQCVMINTATMINNAIGHNKKEINIDTT